MTQEEIKLQESLIREELREYADFYGGWDELKKVINELEEADNEAKAERYFNEPGAWDGGFADNH